MNSTPLKKTSSLRRRTARPLRPTGYAALLQLLVVAYIALLVAQKQLSSPVPMPLAKSKRAMILTAHPDDEVMFFSPTILALRQAGVQVFGLSLSNGNADGLGPVRETELRQAYQVLGVPASQVASLDDDSLQDGMSAAWHTPYIVGLIERYILALEIDTLVTFDEGGITGHANHQACYQAARLYQQSYRLPNAGDEPLIPLPQIFVLQTISPPWKFLGLPKALLDHVAAQRGLLGQGTVISLLGSPSDYVTALRAMARHKSQLVWFRYLYVLVSTYMRANTLVRLE